MRSFDFLKKKKALTAAGLTIVCMGMALLFWTAEKGRAGKVVENSMEKSSAEPGSEQTVEPDLIQVPASGSQEGTIEGAESVSEQEPVLTAEYELLYEGISLFDVFAYTAFQMDTKADLYMRRLQEEAGESIELSLWRDQEEIWYTTNDSAGDYDLFYQEPSESLTLDRKLCYYVVPFDQTVYLMRYCVETTPEEVTMSYKVFGIGPMLPYSSLGSEETVDAGCMTVYLVSDGRADRTVAFPVDQMTDFADTVRTYMENGYLAASTLRGVWETGECADGENPFFPHLYDIFPWIPELAAERGINTEDMHSITRILAAIQDTLLTDISVVMPDTAADGICFITGDYYSGSDESYLTVRMGEDGSYGGHLLIDNVLNMDFSGHYDNGILTAAQTDHEPDAPPYEIEIFFEKGRAAVTVTAAREGAFIEVGESLTLDRNELPQSMKIMRNAETHGTGKIR